MKVEELMIGDWIGENEVGVYVDENGKSQEVCISQIITDEPTDEDGRYFKI